MPSGEVAGLSAAGFGNITIWFLVVTGATTFLFRELWPKELWPRARLIAVVLIALAIGGGTLIALLHQERSETSHARERDTDATAGMLQLTEPCVAGQVGVVNGGGFGGSSGHVQPGTVGSLKFPEVRCNAETGALLLDAEIRGANGELVARIENTVWHQIKPGYDRNFTSDKSMFEVVFVGDKRADQSSPVLQVWLRGNHAFVTGIFYAPEEIGVVWDNSGMKDFAAAKRLGVDVCRWFKYPSEVYQGQLETKCIERVKKIFDESVERSYAAAEQEKRLRREYEEQLRTLTPPPP